MSFTTATQLAALAAICAGGSAILIQAWAFGAGEDQAGRLRRWQLLVLLAAPMVVAAATCLAVVAPSIQVWLGGADHCAGHSHHAHVCLAHPAAWHEIPGLAALLAFLFCALLMSGVARFTLRVVRSVRMVRSLDGLATGDGDHGYRVVRSDHVSAWSGWGRVFVTSAAASTLPPDELGALLSHEQAHLSRMDPLRIFLAELLGSLHTPGVRRVLLRGYTRSVEMECDDAAARAHGSLHVASALMACARGTVVGGRAGPPSGALLAGADGAFLESRIRRLLAQQSPPPVAGPAYRLGAVGWAVVLVLSVVVPAADALHHAFETLLGLIH